MSYVIFLARHSKTTQKETLSLKYSGQVGGAVSFSPDWNYLAVALKDSTVRDWDLSDGREVNSLKGHTQPVATIAFRPDGKFLLSRSADGTMREWKLTPVQQPRIPTERHDQYIIGAAFRPEGRHLASGFGKNCFPGQHPRF